jgi:titin
LVADLEDGKNYKFSVRALNAEGYGSYSPAVTIMAATTPGKPETPTILSASSASISIQWLQPTSGGSPITNYNVYVAVGPTVTSDSYSLKTATGLTQQFLMTDVTPAQTYWFKVVAQNLVGTGPLSDGVSRIAASVPSAPVNLAVVSQSTASITFSWQANGNTGGSPVTDFAIYWNQGSGSVQHLVIDSNGLSPTQATISTPTLLADKTYLFWVKARNAVGFSAFSSSI